MSHRAKMDVVGVVRGGRRLARHTTRENPLKVKNALRAVEWSADIYIRWAPASQGKAFLIKRAVCVEGVSEFLKLVECSPVPGTHIPS
jgi:hypothetical protein